MNIRLEAGRRIDFHTKALKELEVGDYVQLQNLRGKYPVKSDQSGVVISKNWFSNYSVKLSGAGLVTKRNCATLWKIDPRSVQSGQTEILLFGQELRAGQEPPPAEPEHRRALGGGVVSNPVDFPVQIVNSPVLSSHPVCVYPFSREGGINPFWASQGFYSFKQS